MLAWKGVSVMSTKLVSQGVSWEREVRFSHQQLPWVFGKRQQSSDNLAPTRCTWTFVREMSTCPREVPYLQKPGGTWRGFVPTQISVQSLFSVTRQPHNSFHSQMIPLLQAPGILRLCLISFCGPISRCGAGIIPRSS